MRVKQVKLLQILRHNSISIFVIKTEVICFCRGVVGDEDVVFGDPLVDIFCWIQDITQSWQLLHSRALVSF